MITRRTAPNPTSSRTKYTAGLQVRSSSSHTGTTYTAGLQVRSSSSSEPANDTYTAGLQTTRPTINTVSENRMVAGEFSKLFNDDPHRPRKNFYEGFDKKFLADFEANYPVEHALFKKYAQNINTSLWGNEFRHYELAWRNFASVSLSGSIDVLSMSTRDFSISVYGPQNILSKIPGKIAAALGFYNDAGSVYSGSNLVGITNEALNISINGPQVINQKLFTEIFGSPYEPSLNSLVK